MSHYLVILQVYYSTKFCLFPRFVGFYFFRLPGAPHLLSKKVTGSESFGKTSSCLVLLLIMSQLLYTYCDRSAYQTTGTELHIHCTCNSGAMTMTSRPCEVDCDLD